jgi:hypothetical protein
MTVVRVSFEAGYKIKFVKFVKNLPWMCLCSIRWEVGDQVDQEIEIHTVDKEGKTSLLQKFKGDLAVLSENEDLAVRDGEKIGVYRLVGFELVFVREITCRLLRYCNPDMSEGVFFENDCLSILERRGDGVYLRRNINTETGESAIKICGDHINVFDLSVSNSNNLVLDGSGNVFEIPFDFENETPVGICFVSRDEVCYLSKISDKEIWRRFNYRSNCVEIVDAPIRKIEDLSFYRKNNKVYIVDGEEFFLPFERASTCVGENAVAFHEGRDMVVLRI